MYDTFSDLWQGWSRSFYPAMGNNAPLALLQTVLLFIFGTWPYINLPLTAVLLLLGVSSEPVRALFCLGVLQYLILFWATYAVRRRLREYPNYFFTCPLGGVIVQWISLHSLYTYALKKKILWKERDLNA